MLKYFDEVLTQVRIVIIAVTGRVESNFTGRSTDRCWLNGDWRLLFRKLFSQCL